MTTPHIVLLGDSTFDNGLYASDGATRVLRDVAERLEPYSGDPEMAQAMTDLVREPTDLQDRVYSPSDRKYMQALSMGMREGRKAYVDKLCRPRRKE